MNATEHLVELFMKLPGIGPKQARRFVYFLLRSDNRLKDELIRTIGELKDSGRQCEECYRYFGDTEKTGLKICPICASTSRDKKIIMILEKELDVDAIEKTGFYNGVYFVLGGLVPILSTKPSDFIRIKELVALLHRKIKKDELNEIIFALPVTDQGDNTREYVEKTVSQIVGITKVSLSTLARGLSSGLELEYVDRDTFKSAFDRRK